MRTSDNGPGRRPAAASRLLRQPAGTRWLAAAIAYLLALALWLETLAPAHPLPILLAGVAVVGLIGGPGPGVCVSLASLLAIWWFAAGNAAEAPAALPVAVLLVFAFASGVLLAAGAALRLRVAAGGPRRLDEI